MLILLSFYFYRNTIHEFPRHIHAWSQGDRYALALGFQENGFDLFHPQTYNLNPQFPAEQALEVEEGITKVDFPIHEYAVGLLMTVSGSQSPGVFRLYLLLCSLVGLMFLFLLARKLHPEPWPAFLLLLLVFCSPVFTYYQAGFIPSIPSLASFFAGLFFYQRHFEKGLFKDWILTVAFFSLAALTRTPFVIFLIALTGQRLWLSFRSRRLEWKNWLTLAAGFGLIGGYFLYNSYLAKTYGSVFLGRPQIPESLGEMRDILEVIQTKWLWQYVTWVHVATVGVLILGVGMIRFQVRKSKELKNPLGGLLLIATPGIVLYSLLMARQFVDHDYYFLDTWLPLMALFCLFLIGHLPVLGNRKAIGAWIGTGLAAVGMIYLNGNVQDVRRDTGSWDPTEVTTQNFQGAEQWLDSVGVGKQERVLVLDAYSPNLPFILMKRQGYAVISTRKENMEKAMQFDFDWVVLQDTFRYQEVVDAYPDLLGQLQYVEGNGKISLYKRRNQAPAEGIIGRFAGWKEPLLYEKDFTYDTLELPPMWSGLELLSRECDLDSTLVLGVPRNREFASAFEMRVPGSADSIPSGIAASFRYFTWEFLPGAWWVVQVERGNETIFYHKNPLNDGKKPGRWIVRHFAEKMPPLEKGDIIKAYIWNAKEHAFCIDDYHLELFTVQN